MNREQLLELAERCEKASGPDRELDAQIGRYAPATVAFLGYVPDEAMCGCIHYTASLDAAMQLVPEGCGYEIWSEYGDELAPGSHSRALTGRHVARVYTPHHGSFESVAATPALALIAASLRAIAGQQP